MIVQLALYKPHRWQDIGGYVIAWWTRSAYSHCELIVDGWCYSSSLRDKGVRRKKIDTSADHWVVVDVAGADTDAILALYERTQGTRYGWTDLITQHVLRLPVNDPGWLCSEWCAEALGLAEPRAWSPGMLAQQFGAE